MTDPTTLEIPDLCLVLLVGISGAGKSTFARRHFKATEIISSDNARALVADDENDMAATDDAFALVHFLAGKRLSRGRLTVIDATNVQVESRRSLIRLAKDHECLAVAIVLDVPVKIALARNEARADRRLAPWVVKQQRAQLRGGIRTIKREGFARVHTLSDAEAIDALTITRRPLWNDRRGDHGPFDIIGDVHGCYDELRELLIALGYAIDGSREAPIVTPPAGRRALFLGDLVDRGPDSPAVLRLVMAMIQGGSALCIAGNHEERLARRLGGRDVALRHGLAETMEQLGREPAEFSAEVATFIDRLISHYVLDEGRLVVAHAGLRESYQGRASGRVRAFCLYGETSGEVDEFGLPVRHAWADEYRGKAMVVYGHTPTPEAEWHNNTICIDQGCVFGGKLSALRYPERELVAIPARRTYYEPVRPLVAKASARPTDVLDLSDVTGKRSIATQVLPTVRIREENAAAALEVMSRFAVDPRWLIYLPPTMSPAATAPAGDPHLERPHEVFAEFAELGVPAVVCEEKHMGSRAVVIVAVDVAAAERRFRVGDRKQGVITTRTGRPFFSDDALEQALIARIAGACARAGLFEELGSEWLCLDVELMPWSLKARELLRGQYAAVGAAASASLTATNAALAQAQARGVDVSALAERFTARAAMVADYNAAWRRYCWETPTIEALRVAPFHLLASEDRVHVDRDHVWHMDTLARLAAVEPLIVATPYRVVELADADARAAAITWWEELTAAGGEGMVVKPREWIVRGKKGLVQPAIKCRGREYLRIIYGPEYSAPDNLERLRPRGLSGKRSLALREFALGVESLTRFVAGEGLYRVHECVFGVLALESEPVDPRL